MAVRDFIFSSDRPPAQWVPGFSQGQCDRGVALAIYPPLGPGLSMGRAIYTFTPPLCHQSQVTGRPLTLPLPSSTRKCLVLSSSIFVLSFYLLTFSRTEAGSFSQSTGGTTENSVFGSRKGKDAYFVQSIQTVSEAHPDLLPWSPFGVNGCSVRD